MKQLYGSQPIPFIFESRIAKEDYIAALLKMYNMPVQERRSLGLLGREHLLKNYNSLSHIPKWDQILTDLYNQGTWENRKHKSFNFEEI